MSISRSTRVFIDSSVLIAASISSIGNARELLRRGLRGEEHLFISELILDESERNIARKAPAAVPAFAVFREILSPWIVRPSAQLVNECMRVVEPKDAPIIAGALAADAQWIVSYDRRHILSQREPIFEHFSIKVGTPVEFLGR